MAQDPTPRAGRMGLRNFPFFIELYMPLPAGQRSNSGFQEVGFPKKASKERG